MRATKKSTQKKPVVLISFIALSLLAHGLLFLFQTNTQNRLAHTSLGTNRLSISLVSAKTNNTTATHTRLTVKEPLQKTPQKLIEQITPTEKPAQIVITTHNSAPATVKKPEQQTIPEMTQRNFLLGEIQHRLSRYLSYPVRARRRGWQGEVMVGFHVDKQGVLHNVHLAQTSGYSLLDNAALNAIEKIKNIPLSTWLEKSRDSIFHPTSLQLPVIYRLTNS